MLTVENRVRCYEVNHRETPSGSPEFLRVCSHWNRREFVVMETLDGTKVAVLAADLLAAIQNAQNSGAR